MAALISSVMSTKDKVPFFVAQCEDMGIEVLPPDVNQSGHDFVVVDGNIRFGLDAVKGVGYLAVEAIIEAREEGGRSRRSGTSAGASTARPSTRRRASRWSSAARFDSLAGTRTGMLEVLPQAQASGARPSRTPQSGRARSSTSTPRTRRRGPPRPADADVPDDRKQLNEWEKETLGLFLSSHPLKEVRPALRARVDCSLADLRAQEGRRVGDGRRHDRRVQAHPHEEGRPDDVRHARRPRGPGRAARLQLRLRRERGQGRRRQAA